MPRPSPATLRLIRRLATKRHGTARNIAIYLKLPERTVQWYLGKIRRGK